jgi:5'-3' exonuclease
MGISVLEVPGVEADDVIGALSLRAVKDPRMKVRIASPDRDFFQILSTQLRILRFPSKGSGIVSFGLEEFAQRFGSIQPTQFVDVLALTGDKVDNIPGVAGIGEKTALKLVQEFGSVENLLERRSEVVLKRARESLMLDDGGILLSKRLLSLKVDLPAHILPHTLDNFVCQIPKDQGENFTKLLQAMERYVDSSISQDLEKRVHKIWKRWQGPKSLAPIIERLES